MRGSEGWGRIVRECFSLNLSCVYGETTTLYEDVFVSFFSYYWLIFTPAMSLLDYR